jgi:chemotaxis protein MotB
MKFRLDVVLGIGLVVALAAAAAAAWWGNEKSNALAEVEAQLTAANAKAATVAKAAKAVSDTAEQLKAREDELRASLKKEIESRDVEISQLKGKLSVRVLDRVLFHSGSAKILPAGEKVLAKLALALAKGGENVHVEGHTDNVPIHKNLKSRYATNWELSTARAASVARYLQYKGKIDPKRIEAVGVGEYRPVAPNNSAANRQRNRRVEIILTAHPVPDGGAAGSK